MPPREEPMEVEQLKRRAGFYAVEYVQNGMTVGLGSGSTAWYATLRLAEKLREGSLRDIVGIPTSNETAALAEREGIPLTTLDEHGQVDVTIDGADQVDPDLNVIKGLGGFLLREKIVAYATRQQVIVVDETKLVGCFGSLSPVPVEIVPFGWRNTLEALERTGAAAELRHSDGEPYVTDEGNYIVDCRYTCIDSPAELSHELNAIPGVVENGLFVGMVSVVVAATRNGLRVMAR